MIHADDLFDRFYCYFPKALLYFHIDGDQKPSQKQRLKMQPLRHEGRIVHLRKYELLNRIVVVTAVVKLPDIETSVVSKDRLMPQASWNH